MKYYVLACTEKIYLYNPYSVTENMILNLPVPRSYFSEKGSWKYEYFTYVYMSILNWLIYFWVHFEVKGILRATEYQFT